jgi:hypothetical protein
MVGIRHDDVKVLVLLGEYLDRSADHAYGNAHDLLEAGINVQDMLAVRGLRDHAVSVEQVAEVAKYTHLAVRGQPRRSGKPVDK